MDLAWHHLWLRGDVRWGWLMAVRSVGTARLHSATKCTAVNPLKRKLLVFLNAFPVSGTPLAALTVSGPAPLVLMLRVACREIWVRSIAGEVLTGDSRSAGKNGPCTTSSRTNPRWMMPEFESGPAVWKAAGLSGLYNGTEWEEEEEEE